MKGRVWRRMQEFVLAGGLLPVSLVVSACHNHSGTSRAQPQTAQHEFHTDSSPEKDCREFVQRFYDWYFDRLNEEMKTSTRSRAQNPVLKFRPEALTPRLRTLLREDIRAQARNRDYIVGLDFDPFINAEDWEGAYRVENVTLNGDTCRATVWGSDTGAKREIVAPELKLENGRWIFVNFHYPGSANPNDKNLIDLLIQLRNDRKHSK
jgi:hypothetical protein